MVMTAMGADGEYVAAAAHQQNLLVADMAQQLVVLEIAGGDTLGQIRAARRCLLLSHGLIPPLARSAEKRCRIKNRWIAAEKVPAPGEKYQFTVIAERKVTSHNTLYRFNCALSHSTMVVVMWSDGSPGVRPMCAPSG
jgi:hypothetical protein